jgi:hypothetical protein
MVKGERMKTTNRVITLLLLFSLSILSTGVTSRMASGAQAGDQCVRDCAANNERYHYYVEQLRKGSCQACAHCAAAALYQCTLDNCQLTEEQRKDYSEKRDAEMRAAEELGTKCQIR